MTKKKKSPPKARAEAILWHDAAIRFREKLDESPTLNLTVGLVVYESKDLIAVAHEITTGDDWMDDVMDYTKIPTAMILKRMPLGEIPVVEEVDETKAV